MQQNYKDLFPELPDHSRVWVYTSNRVFTPLESGEISKEVDSFVSSWKAHQKSLSAAGTILLNRCLVFAVDEQTEAISGCSIDSSVKFVKSIGQQLDIDFFNRLNMLIIKDEEPTMISFHELEMYKDSHVFNPNVDTLKNMRTKWLIPISESPFI